MQWTSAQISTRGARRGCWLLTFALLALSPANAAEPCQKSLRWNDDPPYSMLLADGSVRGISIDTHTTVLERLGCKTVLRKLPWARALRELETGRLDILHGAFRRPEGEVYAHFSGQILPPARNLLFAHPDAIARWPVNRLTDLASSPFRLGAQIDVQYGPDYQLLTRDADYAGRVAMVNRRKSLWYMVAKGRIDGAIADEHTGAWEIQQLGLADVIKATHIVVSDEAAEVALSKASNDVAFIASYAAALQDLVNDGTYQQIVERYLTP